MKLPIILVDGNDVNVYLSEEELICDLEPIDVRNQTFLAYDSDGCSIKLLVDNNDIVSVEEPKKICCNQENLKKILAKYIGYVLGNKVASSKSLNELIDTLLTIYKKK